MPELTLEEEVQVLRKIVRRQLQRQGRLCSGSEYCRHVAAEAKELGIWPAQLHQVIDPSLLSITNEMLEVSRQKDSSGVLGKAFNS